MQIVDTRPAESFANGQIATSVNVPAPEHLDENGLVKSEGELRALYEGQGVDVAKPMVFSCGGGIMASLAYQCAIQANFGAEIYLYDGSWSEYKDKISKEEQ